MKALIEHTTRELASYLVGDGKRPNMYFITIGYGWFLQLAQVEQGEAFDDGAKEVKIGNALEPVTILVKDIHSAKHIFRAIDIEAQQPKYNDITSVLIEDRLTGCLLEKRLIKTPNGNFKIDQF